MGRRSRTEMVRDWARDRMSRPRRRSVDVEMGRPLTTVARVPKSSLSPGNVVWAHVPYDEGDREKTRPAVVASVEGRTISLLPITSASRRTAFAKRYAEIFDFAHAGLTRPCAVALKIKEVDLIDIVAVAGRLSDIDRRRILEPDTPPGGGTPNRPLSRAPFPVEGAHEIAGLLG